MAVNITTVLDGATVHVVSVEATADADTTAIIPHTLGVVPALVAITPLAAAFYTSQWRVTGIDAVNVTLTKGTAVGSGVVGTQVRVNIQRPHSLVA